MSFEVIPAIDLRGGQVVRLLRGNFEAETVYHPDPVALARDMAQRGVRRLHVVDLDGARSGRPRHAEVIQRMVSETGLQVQIGGGIRSLETAATYLEAPHPARWVILGTAALRDPALVRSACERWPGRILVGIDARRGRVAVEGWLEVSEATPLEVAQALAGAGVAGIVYTDIARDGTGEGPNVAETVALAQKAGVGVIASGGVATCAHLEALAAHADGGVVGVVVGRAILSGALPLESALAVCAPEGTR